MGPASEVPALESAEEQALLERVLKQPKTRLLRPKGAFHTKSSDERRERTPRGGQSWRAVVFWMLAKLLLVLTLFGAMAWSSRPWRKPGATIRPRKAKIAASLVESPNSPPAARAKGKMIEVVSTLWDKKSISVVKIAGRTLVLGVTDDSVMIANRR